MFVLWSVFAFKIENERYLSLNLDNNIKKCSFLENSESWSDFLCPVEQLYSVGVS